MVNYIKINDFLYNEREDLDVWKAVRHYDQIQEMDNDFEDVWNYAFIDLCQIYFEHLKNDFLKRIRLAPQPKKFIEIEAKNIRLEKNFEYAYHFCNNTKLFPDNHSLYSFIREELFGKQPLRSILLEAGYEINLYSFVKIARHCLQNGSYAYYEAFLEKTAKKYNIPIDKIIGLTYTETLEKERFSSKENEKDLDELIKKTIAEINKTEPININSAINEKYDIELIRNYINIENEVEENRFIEILDSIYGIVRNRQNENIKEHKLQIRYTIHLLIKIGWIKNKADNARIFLKAFNSFFSFSTTKKDVEQFDFYNEKGTGSVNLITSKNNDKFEIIYNKLRENQR